MNTTERGKKKLSAQQGEALLKTLKARFEKNMSRHKGLDWAKVEARLKGKPDKLWALGEMERTGGEPDLVSHDKKTDEYMFADCAPQTPENRVSLCYDDEALAA